jgi:hypothetical protein
VLAGRDLCDGPITRAGNHTECAVSVFKKPHRGALCLFQDDRLILRDQEERRKSRWWEFCRLEEAEPV